MLRGALANLATTLLVSPLLVWSLIFNQYRRRLQMLPGDPVSRAVGSRRAGTAAATGTAVIEHIHAAAKRTRGPTPHALPHKGPETILHFPRALYHGLSLGLGSVTPSATCLFLPSRTSLPLV